jgi:hypothetical protein
MNKTYTRVYVDLPKEQAAKFKEAAKENGTTVAGIFKTAVVQFLEEKDRAGEKQGETATAKNI